MSGDVALACVIPALLLVQVGTGSVTGSMVVAAVGGAAWSGCMLIRRDHPWQALVGTFAVALAMALLGVGQEGNYAVIVAGFAAMYTLAALVSLPQAVLGFVIAVGAAFASAVQDSGALKSSFAAFVLAAALVIGRSVGTYRRLGQRLQTTLTELERTREEAIAARLADERVTIARELHDIVAHAVSVMVIQAEAAETVLDTDPERARQPIRTVQESGRQAIGDLRRLLGVLRPGRGLSPTESQPGLANLAPLVRGLADSGIIVDVHQSDELAGLPAGVDLAAFRIVQEALTNVLKHAHATRVRLDVQRRGHTVDIDIVDNGHGSDQSGSHGHGLLGMRERAHTYDGTLTAGPQPGGGFRVTARLQIPDAT